MVGDVDPHAVTPAEAAALVELLGTVTRVGMAGMTVLAARGGESTVWRPRFSDAQAWLADHAGLGWYDGKRLLEASHRLDRNPGEVLGAMVSGEIAPLKAAEALAARDAIADHRRQTEAERLRREAEAAADDSEDDEEESGQGALFDEGTDDVDDEDDDDSEEADASAGLSPEEVERDLLDRAREHELARVRAEAERLKAAARDQKQRARHRYRVAGDLGAAGSRTGVRVGCSRRRRRSRQRSSLACRTRPTPCSRRPAVAGSVTPGRRTGSTLCAGSWGSNPRPSPTTPATTTTRTRLADRPRAAGRPGRPGRQRRRP